MATAAAVQPEPALAPETIEYRIRDVIKKASKRSQLWVLPENPMAAFKVAMNHSDTLHVHQPGGGEQSRAVLYGLNADQWDHFLEAQGEGGYQTYTLVDDQLMMGTDAITAALGESEQ